MIFATSSLAFDNACEPVIFDCGNKTNKWVCKDQTSGQFYLYPLSQLNGNLCSEKRLCTDVNRMFDNCFLDKMKGRSKYEMFSVRRSCRRIACHPTFFQKLKYD